MQTTEQLLDLCSTCSDYPVCASDSRRPVLFCEQFVVLNGKVDNEDNNKPVFYTRNIPYIKSDDQQLKGLCVSCDHRETCPLAKREGGIWHCEEYQ